jgi:MerR family transcriptional regulator, light-induced transcriptional regulator
MAHVAEKNMPDKLNSIFDRSGTAERNDSGADIAQLVETFIASAPGQFIDELERLGLDSLPFSVFYRDLIKPIACTLGDMWSEDTAGFLGVSIAIERLRLAVEMLYPDDDFDLKPNAKRVLISCFENGRHDFGAFLLGKAFSCSNWLVDSREWNVPVGSPMTFLAREHYDMFALSVGAPFDVDAVATAIASVRAKTMNPNLVVALGGVGPALDPEAFAKCGADFISKDVFDAVAQAEISARISVLS